MHILFYFSTGLHRRYSMVQLCDQMRKTLQELTRALQSNCQMYCMFYIHFDFMPPEVFKSLMAYLHQVALGAYGIHLTIPIKDDISTCRLPFINCQIW